MVFESHHSVTRTLFLRKNLHPHPPGLPIIKTKFIHKFGLASLAATMAIPALARSPHTIEITPVGSIIAGSFDSSAAEIAAYDPAMERLFVVNAQAPRIDVISIADLSNPVPVDTIEVVSNGAVANSVAVYNGVIAVAIEANPNPYPGKVVFFDSSMNLLYAPDTPA